MVSVAYLITLLCTLVAVSRAEEASNHGQPERLEARWFGNFMGMNAFNFYSGYGLGLYTPWLTSWAGMLGGCYGYSLFNGMYNNMLFAKANEDASVSRRAIPLDADQLHRRAAERPVSCINEKGESAQFLKSDCVRAANQLSEKKISSASHGGCTLSLVSPKDRVAPKQIPAPALQKAVDGILKACSTRRTTRPVKRATTESHDKDVAMVLSKPHH